MIHFLIGRYQGVKLHTVALHDFRQMRHLYAVGIHALIVGVYKGGKPLASLHDKALRHIRHVVELGLYLLGIDILP